MNMFECQGWVTIWASPDDSVYSVRLRHQDCHKNYIYIDLPDDVKKFIADNPMLRAPQLWKEILKSHPHPNFTQKSVYNQWYKQYQVNWRLHDDELKSAKMLLEELAAGSTHEVEVVHLPEKGSFHAVAFVLPSLLRKYGQKIREIALDSTFKTTRSGYELFGLLGEVSGSGVPLGFLLLKSNDPAPNEKEQYIRLFVRPIIQNWGVEPMQALTDKDITEINAFLSELPDNIKYQLCFWHSIRAVKKCLAVLGRHPARGFFF
ncbi:hypothetical protein GGX14DRAFT_367487 [Mycena pura]|uniref:MULE transposase domain-containing protein n=1 Tax=Mycena pura TaxID=153505 RepID=A0AAD6V8L3_9AGAR|nr:hypothetical protein GGX14DRAFT_367487 [Mycena pura]